MAHDEIRPPVLFGDPVLDRAEKVGASERTLYRRISRFESEGMHSLFAAEGAKRLTLPPSVRRLIVDPKAEYPALGANEVAKICYARFGRRPDYRNVGRVLAEEAMPLRVVRRFPPYAGIAEPRERRLAVMALHAEKWSARAKPATSRPGRFHGVPGAQEVGGRGPRGLGRRPPRAAQEC